MVVLGDLLFVICHLSFVICHLSFVICHLSFVICYLLFVICHLSLVICHWSFVICYLLFVQLRSCTMHHKSGLTMHVFVCDRCFCQSHLSTIYERKSRSIDDSKLYMIVILAN
ncbi:MAG: hypothetical protein F6K31_29095 [Symploca sp. SIO2G7]|nr:hypothetical protein [Symploca sp. SIO2G7]